MSDDDRICRRCGVQYCLIRFDDEPTDWCHRCAQHLLPKLVDALRKMVASHGMHGPCRRNNCRDCTAAYNEANAVIEEANESGGS